MHRDAFDQALDAIADGVPPAWTTIESEKALDEAELAGLHLLEDVAAAFRGHAGGDASTRPPPLFLWGSLRVEEPLGEGTYAHVWRAFDPWLEQEVALKLEREPRSSDTLGEARRLARIRHPNVLACFGCAVHDGRAGLWTEVVDGRSLAAILRDDGACSIEEVLRIGRDLARGLAAMHAAGLVHGDIKAENVMRERGGRIVLMDFGAGGEERLLAERRIVSATPAYLAPEVIDGAPQTRRSDLHAFGVLMYLLLTGSAPYAAEDLRALRDAQRAGARRPLRSVRPELDAATAALIERCLEADPSQRPRSADDVARDLAEAAAGGSRNRRADRRRRLAGAVLAGALAIVAFAFAWPHAFPAWSADVVFVRSSTNGDEALAATASVRDGDRLRLRVSSNRSSHVYVLNEDAAGNAIVLFPLAGGEDPLPAATVTLPGGTKDPSLAWEVTPGADREEFIVVVSLERLPTLDSALAGWVRNGPEPATRSLGRVVSDEHAPLIRGERLRALLSGLSREDGTHHIWQYAFVHAPRQ